MVQGEGCTERKVRSSCDVRLYGLGFRVQGAGFSLQGAEFRVQGAGFRIQGSGSRVQSPGSESRTQCSGWRCWVAWKRWQVRGQSGGSLRNESGLITTDLLLRSGLRPRRHRPGSNRED